MFHGPKETRHKDSHDRQKMWKTKHENGAHMYCIHMYYIYHCTVHPLGAIATGSKVKSLGFNELHKYGWAPPCRRVTYEYHYNFLLAR